MISSTNLNLLGPACNIRARTFHHHREGLNLGVVMTRVPDISTEIWAIWSEKALVGQIFRAASLRGRSVMLQVANLAHSREVWHNLAQIAEHPRPAIAFPPGNSLSQDCS